MNIMQFLCYILLLSITIPIYTFDIEHFLIIPLLYSKLNKLNQQQTELLYSDSDFVPVISLLFWLEHPGNPI